MSRSDRYAARCKKQSEEISIYLLCEIPIRKKKTFDIFLSGKEAANDIGTLANRSIKYIVNAADDVPNYHPTLQDGNVKGMKDTHIISAINFVKKALQKNDGNVLIHCKAGANRSATIALAVLLTLNETTLDEEYNKLSHLIHNQIAPENLQALLLWYKKNYQCDTIEYPTIRMKKDQLKLKQFVKEFFQNFKEKKSNVDSGNHSDQSEIDDNDNNNNKKKIATKDTKNQTTNKKNRVASTNRIAKTSKNNNKNNNKNNKKNKKKKGSKNNNDLSSESDDEANEIEGKQKIHPLIRNNDNYEIIDHKIFKIENSSISNKHVSKKLGNKKSTNDSQKRKRNDSVENKNEADKKKRKIVHDNNPELIPNTQNAQKNQNKKQIMVKEKSKEKIKTVKNSQIGKKEKIIKTFVPNYERVVTRSITGNKTNSKNVSSTKLIRKNSDSNKNHPRNTIRSKKVNEISPDKKKIVTINKKNETMVSTTSNIVTRSNKIQKERIRNKNHK